MKWFLNWRIWVGIAVSIISSWLTVRDIPFSEFWDYLGQANYLWLIPGILCVLLATAARGQRWAVLLDKKVSAVDTFWAFSIGNLFNNILPLRAGDAVRIIVLTDKSGIPAAKITTTVVVERLMDVATILLLFAVILPFMDVPDFAVQAGLTFTLAVLLGIFVLVMMVRYREWSYRLLETVLSRLSFLPKDRILKLWLEAVDGLQPMANLKTTAEAMFYSLVGWMMSVASYYFVLIAFGSQSPVIESIFLVVVISLAISLPSSPGFIGVFHLAGQQALVQPFGDAYTESTAFGVILVAYIAFYIISSTIGGFGLLHFGKRFFVLSQRVSNDSQTTSS
jgi:glycosyltransferase 2 family protein